jgi:hypothetical protein
MTAVMVDIGFRQPPAESDELEFIDDLDDVVDSSKCSCNAGDDNPY